MARLSVKSIDKIEKYVHHGCVVVFDTETTGISKSDEICQLAAIKYVNGVKTQEFCEYITPTCSVNPMAEAVHHLSDRFLQTNGRPARIVLREFLRTFLYEKDVLLVAHNATFDLRMLEQSFSKSAILDFSSTNYNVCCTLCLAKALDPSYHRYKSGYKLCDLIRKFNLPGRNSHNAIDDARSAANLFFYLFNKASKNKVVKTSPNKSLKNVVKPTQETKEKSPSSITTSTRNYVSVEQKRGQITGVNKQEKMSAMTKPQEVSTPMSSNINRATNDQNDNLKNNVRVPRLLNGFHLNGVVHIRQADTRYTSTESSTKTSEFETSRTTPNPKASTTEDFTKSHIHSIENDSSDSDSWRRMHIHRRPLYNQPNPHDNQYNNRYSQYNNGGNLFAKVLIFILCVIGVVAFTINIIDYLLRTYR